MKKKWQSMMMMRRWLKRRLGEELQLKKKKKKKTDLMVRWMEERWYGYYERGALCVVDADS